MEVVFSIFYVGKAKQSKKRRINVIMVTYPLNHDIFYNWDSRFEAYFVKVPGSVERNTLNDAIPVAESQVCNSLQNIPLTFRRLHLLSIKRHLDFAGRRRCLQVEQQSFLGKNIGPFLFGCLYEHLWREHCLFSLLLLRVAQLSAHPTAS